MGGEGRAIIAQIDPGGASAPHVDTLDLVWAGTRLVSADPRVRRAIAIARGADDLERLLVGLEVADQTLATGLRDALRDGRAFEAAAPRLCGGEIAASARPVGRRILMSLRLSRSSPAQPDSHTLMQAAEAAGTPIWLRGPDGAARWRNRACERVGLDLNAEPMRRAAATAAATGAVQSLRVDSAADRGLIAMESPGGFGFAALERAELAAQPQGACGPDAAVAALEGLASGVAIFGAGRRLIYANCAFRDFWSMSAVELDARPRFENLLDRMRESGRLPAVGNYALWREEVAEWADPQAEAPGEDDWCLADGSAIRISRRVDDAARVVICFRNISGEVALERRFRRTLSIQRRTLDALKGGVALLGPDGRMRLANPAFTDLWRLNPAQARDGVHISDIPAPASTVGAADAWSQLKAAATGGEGRTESRFRLAGRALHAVTSPMPDGSILACIDDRTAAERAESALRERGEALEAAAELRAALADCVSVKLRTALTSISGFAELMALDCDAPALEGPLHAILAATAEMAKAIEEIEDLTAPDDGGAVSADQLLSLTADLLSRALWSAEARLEQVNDSDGCVFQGDTSSLRQIALSMAVATLEGVAPGGVLRLTAGQSAPDAAGRRAATLTAEMEGPALNPARGARLTGAITLAERIGATLTASHDGGRRILTLTGARSGE